MISFRFGVKYRVKNEIELILNDIISFKNKLSSYLGKIKRNNTHFFEITNQEDLLTHTLKCFQDNLDFISTFNEDHEKLLDISSPLFESKDKVMDIENLNLKNISKSLLKYQNSIRIIQNNTKEPNFFRRKWIYFSLIFLGIGFMGLFHYFKKRKLHYEKPRKNKNPN
jgi:hypothetical protein